MRYLIKLDDLYLADFADEEVETTPSQYEATRYRKEELKAVLWDANRFCRQDGQRTDKIRAVRLVTKGGKVGRANIGKRYVAKIGEHYLTRLRTEAAVYTRKSLVPHGVRWVQLVAKKARL